jgi:maleate isomerase
VGLIIPSSDRLSEVHFARYSPPGVQFHTTRLRMTGAYDASAMEILDRIQAAAVLLADARVDLIVFHCTSKSMEGGPDGAKTIAAAIREATGIQATTTATAVVAALRALRLRRIVLVTPYPDAVNAWETRYLGAAGVGVLATHGLALGGWPTNGDAYLAYSPAAWYERLLERRDDHADGYFVSCTMIRIPEVLGEIEAALGRPVVASNQATLWHVLRYLGIPDTVPGLGRLLAVA